LIRDYIQEHGTLPDGFELGHDLATPANEGFGYLLNSKPVNKDMNAMREAARRKVFNKK
jgi:hypothetical protein